jgi:hypothetical protein
MRYAEDQTARPGGGSCSEKPRTALPSRSHRPGSACASSTDSGRAWAPGRACPDDDQQDRARLWRRIDARHLAADRRRPRVAPPDRLWSGSTGRRPGRGPPRDPGARDADGASRRIRAAFRARDPPVRSGQIKRRRAPSRRPAPAGPDRGVEHLRRYRSFGPVLRSEARRGGSPGDRPVGRGRPHGCWLLGGPRNSRKPGAGRSLSGAVREPVPGFVAGLARNVDQRVPTSGAARNDLVRRPGNTPARDATGGPLNVLPAERPARLHRRSDFGQGCLPG